MADYNIYIHSMDGEGGGASQNGTPTFNPTAPWGSQESESSTVSKANFKNKSPMEIAETARSISKSGGAMSVIAVAYAATKAAYQVIKTYDSFISIETGDYRNSIAISNYEATKHAIFHPINAVTNRLRSSQQNRLENQRTALS